MSYHVIPMRLEEHRSALLRLWRNFESPCMDAAADRRLEWLYRQNPLGPARTWLAVESGGDEVIGCGSVCPAQKYVRGRLARIGITVDFAVEPGHRSAGAAVAIQRALTRECRSVGFDALIGKPNRKAIPVFTRVGYRPIGDCRNWVKALDVAAGSGSRLDGCFVEELVSAADRRFDELWDRGKSRCRIVGEKTAAYLNWRYAAFAETGYGLYCVVDRDDQRLEGYIVFARMDKGAFIAECFADDLMGRSLQPLLLGFAARMRAEGHEWIALSYLGDPSFEDRLMALGFLPRQRTHAVLGYVDPDAAAAADDIFDGGSSLVFGGEMDLF
jgi:GNAT superfamily N-acetyltransferase